MCVWWWGGESALGETSVSSTILSGEWASNCYLHLHGSVISHFRLPYLDSKAEEQSLKVAK